MKESLSRGFVVYDRYLLDEVPRGPFTLASEYYTSLASILREHASLRLNPRCLLAPCPLPECDTNKHLEEARSRSHDFVRLGPKISSSTSRMDYIVVPDLLAEIRKEWEEATYKNEVCPVLLPSSRRLARSIIR